MSAVCVQAAENTGLRVDSPSGDELDRLTLAVPPMRGAEYLTPGVLAILWGEIDTAFRIELAEARIQELGRRGILPKGK